ncbi:hypothetical protein [Parafrankia discariae]|uniref:hypothetical protein n=1 Tax=Parafrankia discariae TaxID=365528 RepID=UPI001E60362A|nr:hypothetical protein [Parafrankia discariae]
MRDIAADPHGTREQRRAARNLSISCPLGCAKCRANGTPLAKQAAATAPTGDGTA